MALPFPNPFAGQTAQPVLPRVPWGSNPMVTMAGLSLLGGRNLNEGLSNVAANAGAGMAAKSGMQQFMLAQQEREAAKAEQDARKNQMNEMLKAWPGLSPEQRALAQMYPDQFAQKAFSSMGGGGAPYEGTGMDAQNWNIILTGDPASPQYSAAYSQLFAERMEPSVDAAGNQVIVPIKPVIPPGVRPPAGMAQPAPQRPNQEVPGQTTGGDPRVGEPIVIGNPKPSDTAMNAALYADRMAKSNEIITSLERAGTSYSDMAKSNVPLGIGNYLISDDYRQLDQAQRDFINATLRRESGAVISPQEFDNARKQYFPQPGDDPQTIENKRANRQTAIDGIARAAGASYKPPAGGGVISLDEWLKQNP